MQPKNRLLLGTLIFLVSYPLILLAWIQLKPYYGSGLTQMGTHLSALTMGCIVEKVAAGKEDTKVSFVHSILTRRGLADLEIDVRLSVSSYSFNVPLTLALIASLFPVFRWRKRSLFEAAFILVSIHLLYVYSYCCLQIYYVLLRAGVISKSMAGQLFWEFLWAFTDNMVIRFEPFLLAVYLWLRA